MRKRIAARILLAVLSAAAGLGLALRFLALPTPKAAPQWGFVPNYALWVIESQRPFYRRARIDGVDFLIPVRRESPHVDLDVIPKRRPAGTHRILVLGESSGYGLGIALSHMAERFQPPNVLQVVNLSIPGAGLEYMRPKLLEGLRYDPDAIICVFGHNLFFKHPGLSSWLSAILSRALSFQSLVPLLERLLTASSYPAAELPRRLAALEDFIRQLQRAGSARRIPVLIATLPSNDFWAPPATRGELEDRRYLDAAFLYHSGNRALAIQKLEAAVLRNASPWASYVVGLWQFKEGHYLEAYQHLANAQSGDGSPASSAVNGLLRMMALAKGLYFFDTAAWIESKSPHHIPGWEDLGDKIHPTESNVHKEARQVLAILARNWEGFPPLPQEASRGRSDPLATDRLRFILATLGADYPAEVTIASLLSFAAKGHGPERIVALRARESGLISRVAPPSSPCTRALLRLAFARSFKEAEKRDWAFKDAEKAQGLCPRWARPSIELGLFALDSGDRRGALTHFNRALKIDPSRNDAAFFAARLVP